MAKKAISEIDQVEDLSATDLFVVSRLSSNGQYVTRALSAGGFASLFGYLTEIESIKAQLSALSVELSTKTAVTIVQH